METRISSVVIEVHYVQRLPELYFLPMAFLPSDSIMERVEYTVQSVICRAEIQGKAGFIMDSSYDKLFRDFLFLSMGKETKIRDDDGGTLLFNSGVFAKIDVHKEIDSKILKADQSNTAIIYNISTSLSFTEKSKTRSIRRWRSFSSYLNIRRSVILPVMPGA